MSAVIGTGWDMYDPRLTIKATVKTGETVGLGDCCYIDGNGYINVSDTDEERCHGCALKAAVAGEKLVLIMNGRLRVQTAQTPGDPVKSQKLASGTGSCPDDAGTGFAVGFAIEEYVIAVNIDSVSAT